MKNSKSDRSDVSPKLVMDQRPGPVWSSGLRFLKRFLVFKLIGHTGTFAIVALGREPIKRLLSNMQQLVGNLLRPEIPNAAAFL